MRPVQWFGAGVAAGNSVPAGGGAGRASPGANASDYLSSPASPA